MQSIQFDQRGWIQNCITVTSGESSGGGGNVGGIIVLSTFLVLGVIAGSVWLVTTKTNIGVLFQENSRLEAKLELTAARKASTQSLTKSRQI